MATDNEAPKTATAQGGGSDDDLHDTIRKKHQHHKITKRSIDEREFDILLSGTSATLMIIVDKVVYTSWVGNGKFAICKHSNQNKINPEECPVHTAKHALEKYRIYDHNGEVRPTIDQQERVFLRGRMFPGTKTTRSFGDLIAHQIGVTSEPSHHRVKISSTDKYIILASDGLWEFFTRDEVLEYIGKLPSTSRDIYGQTVSSVYNRLNDLRSAATTKYQRVFDTTIIVIFLN